MSTWAITSYFHAQSDPVRLANYRRFRSELALPLLTVEVACDGAPWDLPLADSGKYGDTLVQIRGDYLWQKERCLNIALAHLPSDCDRVVAIDADVVGADAAWVEAVDGALDRFPVAQAFTSVEYLDAAGGVDFCWPGVVVGWNRFPASRSVAHGIAWAFRLPWITRRGFYEAMPLGGGDAALSFAALGIADKFPAWFGLGPEHAEHYLTWARGFTNPPARPGFAPSTLRHLWHGSLESRHHPKRKGALPDFDPLTDLGGGPALSWASDKPGLHARVRAYLESRR